MKQTNKTLPADSKNKMNKIRRQSFQFIYIFKAIKYVKTSIKMFQSFLNFIFE